MWIRYSVHLHLTIVIVIKKINRDFRKHFKNVYNSVLSLKFFVYISVKLSKAFYFNLLFD